jgi:hypothetical protein
MEVEDTITETLLLLVATIILTILETALLEQLELAVVFRVLFWDRHKLQELDHTHTLLLAAEHTPMTLQLIAVVGTVTL